MLILSPSRNTASFSDNCRRCLNFFFRINSHCPRPPLRRTEETCVCVIQIIFFTAIEWTIMKELARTGLVGLSVSVVCGSHLTLLRRKWQKMPVGLIFCCGVSGCACVFLKDKNSNFQSLPHVNSLLVGF